MLLGSIPEPHGPSLPFRLASSAGRYTSLIIGYMRGSQRLKCLGRYLIVVIGCSLVWETLQMPLYTIWESATVLQQVVDVVQCTGADVVIALGSLVLAMVVAGNGSWPIRRYAQVGILACGFAVGYTIFSEWLNVQVRHSWAYSDLMPVLPGTGTGLAPVIQWLVIPLAGWWWARRG